MAIDPDTGASVWRDADGRTERPVRMLYGITGALVAAGDDVLVMDNNNELVSVNTVPKKPNWTAKFTSLDATAQPVALGDVIVVNSGQDLAAIRGSSRRAAWQLPAGANVPVGPAGPGE